MSGRELPDPPAKASNPDGRANPWRRGAWAKGMPGVTPRLGSCLPNSCTAVLVPGRAGTLPATGSHPGKGHPAPPRAGRWGRNFLLPLSHPQSPLCGQPLHLCVMCPRSPAGLVHGTGVTRCNFHALDTNIFVWLLPCHLNMSAVPSTDSCAVSSPPTSIQTASRGCWLFPACLRSVTGTGAGSPNMRKRLLGLSGRLPPMPSERSK